MDAYVTRQQITFVVRREPGQEWPDLAKGWTDNVTYRPRLLEVTFVRWEAGRYEGSEEWRVAEFTGLGARVLKSGALGQDVESSHRRPDDVNTDQVYVPWLRDIVRALRERLPVTLERTDADSAAT
jgi:hypothetical protein